MIEVKGDGWDYAIVASCVDYGGTENGHEFARHIAAWSPPVALAVADWLDEQASVWTACYAATQQPSRGVDQPPALHHGDPASAAQNADSHVSRALAVCAAWEASR